MTITYAIIILSVITSYQAFNSQVLFHKLKHNPYMEINRREYYRMLTSGFVHGSWMHLIINMYVLFGFGRFVESEFVEIFGRFNGMAFFAAIYIITIILADMPTFIKYKSNPHYSSIGASGAVSGILFMSILFEPWSMLGLYFVIPIPAILFAILYLVYSSWAVKNSNDNIDHSAHFMGAITGIVLTILIYPEIIRIFVDNLLLGPQ